MSTYLTTRWRNQIPNPTDAQLEAALSELDITDPEHPDAWLSDEEEWFLAAFGSGRVIFGNAETGAESEMLGIPRAKVMELWRALRPGDLAAIRREPWRPR